MTTTTAAERFVFDPYDYAFHEDPYPTYERLRDEAPVYRNPDVDFWALSRHVDVLGAFRDFDRFSSANGVSLDPAAWGPNAHKTMSFLGMDPPRHGRMRGLVSRGFTPRRTNALEPRIREIARRYRDEVIERGSFDFIADFAGKFPMEVISELMGVPESDRAEVRRLSDLLVHREEGVTDVPPSGIEAALSLVVYYSDMVTTRRAARTDDLTSALIDAEIDGDRLTDSEIIGFLFLLVVAGNETTTKLLGNAWYWAWRNPQEQAKPLADAARIPDWIEETLRYDTSSQILARTATVDIDLHGVTIPAGSRVVLLPGSANRDPRVFTQPDVFDLERTDTDQNLASFGFGRHFCMGKSLALLEMRVALEELVAGVGDFSVQESGAERVHSVNVRGFASLPTTVTPR